MSYSQWPGIYYHHTLSGSEQPGICYHRWRHMPTAPNELSLHQKLRYMNIRVVCMLNISCKGVTMRMVLSFNASSVEILRTISWEYFYRWSPEEMQEGRLWDVFSVQGRSRTWYIGSSVSFEAIRSVMEYNNLLVSNMLPHDQFYQSWSVVIIYLINHIFVINWTNHEVLKLGYNWHQHMTPRQGFLVLYCLASSRIHTCANIQELSSDLFVVTKSVHCLTPWPRLCLFCT